MPAAFSAFAHTRAYAQVPRHFLAITRHLAPPTVGQYPALIAFVARVSMPLSKPPARLDCARVYDLEIERLKQALEFCG